VISGIALLWVVNRLWDKDIEKARNANKQTQ
jgi:hypothetical protein